MIGLSKFLLKSVQFENTTVLADSPAIEADSSNSAFQI
jgi:hypothetical protein